MRVGVRRRPATLAATFDSQPNALHFVRLCLALQVLAWHAYALPGGTFLPHRLTGFLGDVSVDAFFALSGFLICRSWQRDPHLLRYVSARARRLLPGLWACLALTAFVIAPVTSWLAGQRIPDVASRWDYVVGNALTHVHQWDIGGGPSGIAHPGVWNGSLWSLGHESTCYLAVAALGVAGLVRRRVATSLALALWAAAALVQVLDVAAPASTGSLVLRTSLMFACGAATWLHADRIPVTRTLEAGSVALVVAGVLLVPADYRLLAAPAVAYLCLCCALRLGRWPRLVLRQDLSYGVYVYGFPVQQALLVLGLGGLGWVGFSLVSATVVLPVAALSWVLVERPFLRRRTTAPSTGTVVARPVDLPVPPPTSSSR